MTDTPLKSGHCIAANLPRSWGLGWIWRLWRPVFAGKFRTRPCVPLVVSAYAKARTGEPRGAEIWGRFGGPQVTQGRIQRIQKTSGSEGRSEGDVGQLDHPVSNSCLARPCFEARSSVEATFKVIMAGTAAHNRVEEIWVK